MEKYLLCRPKGGLNDTLCQIERCWQYAEQHDRTLIVDTTRSCFAGEFSYFFEPIEASDNVIFAQTDELLGVLNEASCFPPEVEGNLGPYNDISLRVAEPTVGVKFDLARDYPQTVLVHGMWGGGKKSYKLLPRLKFTKEMSAIISDRLKSLDPDYTAIHVRNTDYKTDFQTFFRKIDKKTSGEQLLVCSDDGGVVDAAKEFFGAGRIVTVSQPARSGGRPLHDIDTYASGEEMKEAAIDSLVDLVALGNAPRLYVTSVTLGNLSGFSGLAAFLCDHKALTGRLLGRDLGTSRSNAGKGARRLVPFKFRLLKLLPRFMRKTLHWQ